MADVRRYPPDPFAPMPDPTVSFEVVAVDGEEGRELRSEAARGNRRFDAVICESIERVARRTYYGTKIEHDLEQAGVGLFAADEPIILSGKRATAILTRRVKQSVAEWYVLETLEKSW